MLGAIAGDVIGSVYECNPIKTEEFPLFCDRSRYTDDTVLTVAVADAILNRRSYGETILAYAREYPNKGYGSMFLRWMESQQPKSYNSFGNGSAMRVSPIGFAFHDLATVLEEAKKSAECTHNHPEGVKGAQATAASVFLARIGKSKNEIRKYITDTFGYDLNRSVSKIRIDYSFNETCQGTVPEAIIAFLESNNFEDAIRKAVSLGGDSDTLATITGGIAQAFYKNIPEEIQKKVINCLDQKLVETTQVFSRVFCSGLVTPTNLKALGRRAGDGRNQRRNI